MKTEAAGAGTTRPAATPPGGRMERLAQWSARIPFRAKLLAVQVVVAIVLLIFLALVGFDWGWIADHWTFILKGLQYTILIAVGAIVLAVLLALIGALGRLSKNPIAFGVSGFYTSFFRGTPLIVQLFLIYLALPQVAQAFHSPALTNILTLSAVEAGILGLGLNYGAYMTEIFRGGIQSVGHGQGEAAEALGMTYGLRMRRIVLPQAARVIIPPTGNEFIAMMKDTALVSTLGVVASQAELFRRAQLAGKADFRNLEAFVIAAAFYWALTSVFTFFQVRLERRMSKGYVRGSGAQERKRFVEASASGGSGGGGMVAEIPMPEQAQPGVIPSTPQDPDP